MSNDTKNQVINALAKHLDVEPEDIKVEDSLEQDLHIRLADLSDFIENLNSIGLETEKVNFSEIDTVNDLIYALDGETSSE